MVCEECLDMLTHLNVVLERELDFSPVGGVLKSETTGVLHQPLH